MARQSSAAAAAAAMRHRPLGYLTTIAWLRLYERICPHSGTAHLESCQVEVPTVLVCPFGQRLANFKTHKNKLCFRCAQEFWISKFGFDMSCGLGWLRAQMGYCTPPIRLDKPLYTIKSTTTNPRVTSPVMSPSYISTVHD
eukprot:5850462-Amphidinium_carterae.1